MTRLRRARWPWPADSTLDRSRRVGGMYRDLALRHAPPEEVQRLDAWAYDHGEGWVIPTPWPYAEDDLLTLEQVAETCHVEVDTVYSWHSPTRGVRLPYVDTSDGIRVRAADLLEFNRQRRLARLRAS